MLFVSRFLCLAGRHRRSRGHARRVDGGYQSRCRRCGVPMYKAGGGGWKVDGSILPDAVVDTSVPPEQDRRFWMFGKRRKSPAG